MEKTTGLFILQSFFLHNVIEKFSAWYKLHYQKKLSGCLNNFIQLNYVRMSYNLQDLYFPHDSGNVRLLLYFVFLKNFDGNFFASQNMSSKSYFAECSLTNCFAFKIKLVAWACTYRQSNFQFGFHFATHQHELVGFLVEQHYLSSLFDCLNLDSMAS